jgi:metallo-beta-lactamase family protein
MQIQFFGGAQTVTGSQHLLSVNGKNILLECGLYQGRRKEAYERNLNFGYDPKDVDCLVLSHAHIDHSGNIPNLYKNGFRQHICATHATVDLCQLMLRDSAYLNEKDAEYVNKVRRAKHQELIEPLYTLEDADKALSLFVGVNYDRPFAVADGVSVTFKDAGHILGSSGVLLEIEEEGRKFRLGFSGDIGRRDVPILRDPVPLSDLDALIMESTYGSRDHETIDDVDGELAETVHYVVKRNGKLMIPAFAVGRSQMLIYRLHTMQDRGMIPKVPIYVDSPMACNAMDIFRSHPENFDRETYETFLDAKEDPFTPDGFACVRRAEHSKRLNELEGPAIIIAASGMMEGGRILHHLRSNIGDPHSMLLFVGFAAPHTLARRLMDGAKSVKIFGEEHRVKCERRKMPYFSGHADRRGLLDYLDGNSPERLKNIFLVHGELEPAQALKKDIEEKGFRKVHIPAIGDAFTL